MPRKGGESLMPKQIAPRLERGTRLSLHGRLAPAIKAGLRAIAREENRSMSWVAEEVFIDYFGLARPRYKHARPVAPLKAGRRRRAA